MKIKLDKPIKIIKQAKTVVEKKKPQIHKLNLNIDRIENPNDAFDVFEGSVQKILSEKGDIEHNSFLKTLNAVLNKFTATNQLDGMNRKLPRLAENFVNLGNGSLAGIMYSVLIKANHNSPWLVEKFATNGLAIAKRFHDPVHIMARCEDLRRIYSITSPQSDKLLKILYEEKRALNGIINNYEGAKNRFCSVKREMKPRENYQILLGFIKLQIAKIIKESKPKEAIEELKGAYELISSVGKGDYTEEIERLLAEISSKK